MNLYRPPLISHVDALALVTAATDYAKTRHLSIVSCVVDCNARVKAKVAMDGAPVIAETMVEKKARTALLSIDSGAFGKAVEQDKLMLGSLITHPDMTFLPGGFPLFHEGELVGAFAVAGVLPEQDVECAMHAMKLTHWHKEA